MKQLIIGVLCLVTILFVAGCSDEKKSVRIGWQTAWATQAQLALILQKTDILAENEIDAKFSPFNYGAPMAEAAVAGELDIAFVGDQPAVSIMSRSDEWIPIARLMDFRVALVGQMDSEMNKLRSLKTFRLAIPFGSSAHREAIKFIKKLGVSEDKIQFLNVGITEQGEAIKSGRWGEMSAFASWDPHIATYESKSIATVLAEGEALGVVMARKEFVSENPKLIRQFKNAFADAHWYFNQNTQKANSWYIDFANLKLDDVILSNVAKFESNMNVKSRDEVSVELTMEHFVRLQEAATFAFENGLIKTNVDVKERALQM